jgi:hypothetical protein
MNFYNGICAGDVRDQKGGLVRKGGKGSQGTFIGVDNTGFNRRMRKGIQKWTLPTRNKTKS